jgi:hypothetical protein
MGADVVGFATGNAAALTGGVLIAALVGVFVQHRIGKLDVADVPEEEGKKKKKKKKKKDRDEDADEEDDDEPKPFWKRAVA